MSCADLTLRELECLRHSADGYGTKEAARAMGISPWTVKDIRKRVMSKLYAKNITHAVAIAIARGLIQAVAI